MDVGVFFLVVSIPVGQSELVRIAETMVKAAGSQVFARSEIEQAAVVFKLADEECAYRIRGGVKRQSSSQNRCAGSGGYVGRGVGGRQAQACRDSGSHR